MQCGVTLLRLDRGYDRTLPIRAIAPDGLARRDAYLLSDLDLGLRQSRPHPQCLRLLCRCVMEIPAAPGSGLSGHHFRTVEPDGL
jgi:hypothetical protein